MIVRTTVAGLWLAISSIAAPSAGFCEVRTLPDVDVALTAAPPSQSPPAGEAAPPGGLVLGELTFAAQSQAAAPAAQELRRAALNTITAPPQSLWRRLLSAIVQFGGASR